MVMIKRMIWTIRYIPIRREDCQNLTKLIMIEWETPYFLKKKVNTVYPNLGKYKIVK